MYLVVDDVQFLEHAESLSYLIQTYSYRPHVSVTRAVVRDVHVFCGLCNLSTGGEFAFSVDGLEITNSSFTTSILAAEMSDSSSLASVTVRNVTCEGSMFDINVSSGSLAISESEFELVSFDVLGALLRLISGSSGPSPISVAGCSFHDISEGGHIFQIEGHEWFLTSCEFTNIALSEISSSIVLATSATGPQQDTAPSWMTGCTISGCHLYAAIYSLSASLEVQDLTLSDCTFADSALVFDSDFRGSSFGIFDSSFQNLTGALVATSMNSLEVFRINGTVFSNSHCLGTDCIVISGSNGTAHVSDSVFVNLSCTKHPSLR